MIAGEVATIVKGVGLLNRNPGNILDADEQIKAHEEYEAVHHGRHGSGYRFTDGSALVIHTSSGHVTTMHNSTINNLIRMLG